MTDLDNKVEYKYKLNPKREKVQQGGFQQLDNFNISNISNPFDKKMKIILTYIKLLILNYLKIMN